MKKIQTSFTIGNSRISEGDIEKMIIQNISSDIIENIDIVYKETDDPNTSIVEACLFIK